MSSTNHNRLGAIRRFELLTIAVQEPAKAPKALVSACERQDLLAALKIERQKIHPMSLNTLKKSANVAVEGGWNALNKLRREVSQLCRSNGIGAARVAARKDQQLRVKELEEQLGQERRARTVLNRAYSEMVSKLRKVAETDERLKKELDRHVATFNIPIGLEVVGKST